MLFVCKYPENETQLLVNPVPPKARILVLWVWVMSTKLLVKILGSYGVCVADCQAGSVNSYIDRYVLKYVVKFIP